MQLDDMQAICTSFQTYNHTNTSSCLWNVTILYPVTERFPDCLFTSLYRVSGSTLTAVGRSQLLVWWPGTHSQVLSGIQWAAQTVLCVYIKRTCSRITSASSALGVLSDYVLYKSTHSLTHSLTLCNFVCSFARKAAHRHVLVSALMHSGCVVPFCRFFSY